MVIWYISKYASPQKYFFGTRHFYLAEEWVKKEHEVCVFTSNSNHLTDQLPVFNDKKVFYEEINGVKTYWLNTIKVKKGSSSSVLRILSWIHFELQLFSLPKKNILKPDVIIVSSLSLLTVISGLFFSRKYKAKFIFEVRDIWPLSLIELGGYSKWNPFIFILGWVEKIGYKKADAIVGTMPNLQAHVKNTIGGTVKCFTIPQGYSPEFYEKQEFLDSSYIEQYIPQDVFVVMYAGTINNNNPIEVLLESAKLLINESIYFLIVGEGNNKENLIEKYKHVKNIIFAPSVPKNKVNHLLSFSSICFDSFSSNLAKYGLSRNKWIDYMYAGKPIICSYSGFQSMINESSSGTFVEFNNVNQLVDELLKYKNMNELELYEKGKRAHEFIVNKRSFETLANDYLKIFNV